MLEFIITASILIGVLMAGYAEVRRDFVQPRKEITTWNSPHQHFDENGKEYEWDFFKDTAPKP